MDMEANVSSIRGVKARSTPSLPRSFSLFACLAALTGLAQLTNAQSTDPCTSQSCLSMLQFCATALGSNNVQTALQCLCSPQAFAVSNTCLIQCKALTESDVQDGDLATTCQVAGYGSGTSSSGSSSLSTGAIVGIAVGGAVVLIAAAVGIFFLVRKKRNAVPATNGKPFEAAAASMVPISAKNTTETLEKPSSYNPNYQLYPVNFPTAPYPSPDLLARSQSLRTTAGNSTLSTAVPSSPPSPLSSDLPTLQLQDLPNARCTAIRTFLPEREDELPLSIGDSLTIIEAYEDGWAKGRNEITKEVGVFPLACVVRTNGNGNAAGGTLGSMHSGGSGSLQR